MGLGPLGPFGSAWGPAGMDSIGYIPEEILNIPLVLIHGKYALGLGVHFIPQ